MHFPLIKNLRNPVVLLVSLGVALIFFDLSYYLMTSFPGSDGKMCIEGGNLTMENLLFAAVISLFAGLMVGGLLQLYKQRKARLVASSASGAAVAIGALTIFCTVCTLPVLSFFGLSIGLSIFVTYNAVFKVLSMTFMLVGLILLNKQL